MVYIGVITHLLTIDPNFLGHPSRMGGSTPFFVLTKWNTTFQPTKNLLEKRDFSSVGSAPLPRWQGLCRGAAGLVGKHQQWLMYYMTFQNPPNTLSGGVLEPRKAFSGGVWGSKHLFSRFLADWVYIFLNVYISIYAYMYLTLLPCCMASYIGIIISLSFCRCLFWTLPRMMIQWLIFLVALGSGVNNFTNKYRVNSLLGGSPHLVSS